MPSSPTPNAETSTLGQLFHYLQDFELSASLDEKIIKMKGYIFTYSSTSGGFFGQDVQKHSMLRDAIRMCSMLIELRGWRTITQSRREMWLLGEQRDPRREVELRYQELVMSGLKSWQQKVEMSFLTYCRSWLLGASSLVLTRAERLPSGAIESILNHIETPMDCTSKQIEWHCCMSGLRKMWEDAYQVSVFSHPTLRSGVRGERNGGLWHLEHEPPPPLRPFGSSGGAPKGLAGGVY